MAHSVGKGILGGRKSGVRADAINRGFIQGAAFTLLVRRNIKMLQGRLTQVMIKGVEF